MTRKKKPENGEPMAKSAKGKMVPRRLLFVMPRYERSHSYGDLVSALACRDACRISEALNRDGAPRRVREAIEAGDLSLAEIELLHATTGRPERAVEEVYDAMSGGLL